MENTGGMGIAAGFGEGGQDGGSESMENAVTITKLTEGGYKVELAGEMSEGMEENSAEGEIGGQVFNGAEEACRAAISMLDGGGKEEEEKAFMSDYNSGDDSNNGKYL